jgi:hypothetical protein
MSGQMVGFTWALSHSPGKSEVEVLQSIPEFFQKCLLLYLRTRSSELMTGVLISVEHHAPVYRVHVATH